MRRQRSWARTAVGCAVFGLVVGSGMVPSSLGANGGRVPAPKAWVAARSAGGLPPFLVQRGLAEPGGALGAARGSRVAARGGLSADDSLALARRFREEVWPLLTRADGGNLSCVGCHNERSPSQLHFFADAEGSFQRLLTEGFFEPESPASLLARVSAPDRARRMPPPPASPWTDTEVATLRAFANEVFARRSQGAGPMDETFPPALLTRYRGPALSSPAGNTFVSYRQLQGKIRAIFGDEWRRDERDLFAENIQMFGGADFRRRFDESTRPSATFLSAVDLMARDVASRAYLRATGPFQGRGVGQGALAARSSQLAVEREEGSPAPPPSGAASREPRAASAPWPTPRPSPVGMREPDGRYRDEIRRLYRRLLFRDPTDAETRLAFRFLQSVYRAESRLAEDGNDLAFELEATDGHGLSTTRSFTLPVGRGRLRLYQQFVDEKVSAEESLVRGKLEGAFTFKASDPGQELRISNRQTRGNVSIAGVELQGPLPETTVTAIPASDKVVQVEGAWRLRTDSGFTSYEDNNDNKGSSQITVPLRVPKDGRYELTVLWRKGFGGRNSDRVPVEVLSQDREQIALPPAPPVPPRGEAHFTIDQTIDNIAFWDLKTAFRFAVEGDGVEIRNEGTRNRVVADAVKFVPIGAGSTLLLDNDEADGNEKWPIFKEFGFTPYNVTGKELISDGNREKGRLKLLYRPSRRREAWSARAFYRVEVGFPGKADNETQAPVVVHASESSPILRIRAPYRAQLGSHVTMDAAASFNLQQSPLRFTWRQIGGPRVALSDPHAPTVTFTAVPKTAQQAAWEGLCRALIKHPDFLFTRPPSLAVARDPATCRRLQLVKIAQDLVARTPTEAELERLERGGGSPADAPLVALVNDYLAGPEFRSFYFHRIRLYLESHGTEEEDEPARLWCYLAFNNRPFKEILTADYTVDTSFLRRPRPAYHGKTGLLTMKGFIRGKPGLPHFNYAAQVAEKFLGYVFEVPPEIVAQRDGITAVATTSPSSLCYSCHKVLTPLAYQRMRWNDEGEYLEKDAEGKTIDDSDQGLVPTYPFRGNGMEAFASSAQNKERFIRTILQTHFIFYFGREMRADKEERVLYRRLWDTVQANQFSIKGLIRALVTSPEYLEGEKPSPERKSAPAPVRFARDTGTQRRR